MSLGGLIDQLGLFVLFDKNMTNERDPYISHSIMKKYRETSNNVAKIRLSFVKFRWRFSVHQ